jgi:flagellar hook protein FlgE
MYTGVSGLSSHADAMNVISDNVANVNTIGFKASRANFSDVLGGVIGSQRTGAGSIISDVQNIFTQGSLLGTGNATDLAIRGEGFFVVLPPGAASPMYTRAGQFEIDDNGFLVDQMGNRVQGYAGPDQGASFGDLLVDSASLPPTPTSSVEVDANLDAGVTANPATPFDIDDPSATSDYSTSVTVYDSLGKAHTLELHFKKTADVPTPQWEVNVATAAADVAPPGTGERVLLATGTLDFGTDGTLSANTLTSVNVPWAGADAASIALDFGTPTGSGGTGVDGVTTAAGDSAATYLNQDGASSGDLGGFSIAQDGTVTGMYTNGESRQLGQIATATFTASNALNRAGGGLFTTSADSGDPIVGRPGSGGHGSIESGALESSNVDLASEFVNMIAVQRGFQSNSRSITTADEMLTEVVNIKR